MSATLFASWFKDKEPAIYKEIERLRKKQWLYGCSIIAIVGFAFLAQLFVAVGLKIKILIVAIWLILLLVVLVLTPPFIAALRTFSTSSVKKRVALLIAICCVFLVCAAYTVYKLIPFFQAA